MKTLSIPEFEALCERAGSMVNFTDSRLSRQIVIETVKEIYAPEINRARERMQTWLAAGHHTDSWLTYNASDTLFLQLALPELYGTYCAHKLCQEQLATAEAATAVAPSEEAP